MHTITIPIVDTESSNFIRQRLVYQGIVSIHEIDDISPGEVRAIVSRGLIHPSRTPEQCAAAKRAYEAAR